MARQDIQPVMPSNRTAVVVVNFNGGEIIERCLEAVAAQTVRPERTIVVDNASTDGSADRIATQFPHVELIRLHENVGFAGGNNVGARAAEGCDWLALLNPDAFPEPTWLERLLESARTHSDFGFFGSLLLRADDLDEVDGSGDAYHVSGMAWRRDNGRRRAEAHLRAGEIFSPCAAAALYRRDAFLSAGGFDEDFFAYYEDSDLAFRLRLLGERCFYEQSAVVHHVGFSTAGEETPFTVYHSQRNLVWAWVKNMPTRLLLLYLPQHLLVNALNIGWYTARGQAGPVLRSKVDALRGLPGVLKLRRELQARRAVSAQELRSRMETGSGAYLTGFKRAWATWRKARMPKPPAQSSRRTRAQ
jgi:GT2 family glycosyltransferase